MAAGLLRILGVNMGDNISPLCHEDLDLQHRHPIHMRELIDEKNAKYDTWGWKDPLAIDWIDGLFDLCNIRNPVCFVVFRDIIATAEALVKHEGWNYRYAVNYVQGQNAKLIDFANKHNESFPIFLISYERAMAHPEDITRFFAEQVDAELNDDILRQATNFINRGYKELPPPMDRTKIS